LNVGALDDFRIFTRFQHPEWACSSTGARPAPMPKRDVNMGSPMFPDTPVLLGTSV
jgi:hypothetical protein